VSGQHDAPAALSPGKYLGTHLMEGCVDPSARLEGCVDPSARLEGFGEQKIFF
jgi:hypothetical protein